MVGKNLAGFKQLGDFRTSFKAPIIACATGSQGE